MLEINKIKSDKDNVVSGLVKKGLKDAAEKIEQVLQLDEERKKTQFERDEAQQKSNSISKQIGKLMKEGKRDEAEEAKKQTGELKALTKSLNEKVTGIEEDLTQLLYQIPNVPHPSVPEGKSADDNEVVMGHGEIPALHDKALPHWDLISKYDIIDFEVGNKVTGAGFPLYKGKGARLQRALINFFLDNAEEAGYKEFQPPIIINQDSGLATGQLPDKEGQMYKIEDSEFYLIPTAEVPLTNYYRSKLFQTNELPVKIAGYTPCFRREAGSWGADVRGLNRLHQFDKVEIVHIEYPEKSYETLEAMCNHVAGLLEKLELPYRKLRLCGGDISFNAALCFDFEVYSAAQKRWLEVSSVSNFETYQANRLKLRYKDGNKKTQLLHTLNGSALALPRILAALLENNQTENGINIPEVLRPYCRFDVID